MSNAVPLPPHPDLEQYKKLSKDLQDACRSDDPLAIRHWAARWVERLARAYGEAHWPAVRARENEPEDIERRWNKTPPFEVVPPPVSCSRIFGVSSSSVPAPSSDRCCS